MTKEKYVQMKKWFSGHPSQFAVLKTTAKGFTALVYVLYILLVIGCFFRNQEKLIKVLAVPAFVFLSGSFIRKTINAPRPYEVFEEPPLVKKETKGKSFPSRHVFCAAVIACAWGYVCPAAGAAAGAVTAVIAVSRVLTGVHWPKDVLAAMIYGGGIGLLGFFLL